MLEAIEKRNSCRKFIAGRKVEEEKINEVIQAGLKAASGMGLQSGIVVAITNPDTLDKLEKLNGEIGCFPAGIKPFYGASAVLLVAAKKGIRTGIYDGSCMMENMLLEAQNQGLGACWIHRAKEEVESEKGKEILSAAGVNWDEYEGIGHVILGYPASEGSPKPVKSGRVFYIR